LIGKADNLNVSAPTSHKLCYLLKSSFSEIIFLFKLEASVFWGFVRPGVLLHKCRQGEGKEETRYHFAPQCDKVAFTQKWI